MSTVCRSLAAGTAALSLLLAAACGNDTKEDAESKNSAPQSSLGGDSGSSGDSAPGGGTVTKEELAAKLKSLDPADGLEAEELDCVAGVYVKYFPQKELKAIVEGKKSFEDIDISALDVNNSAKAAREIATCVGGEDVLEGLPTDRSDLPNP